VPGKTVFMATSTVSRLASVTARDGVNTRTKVNWATAVAGPRKTICRSDMIIGLGKLAVEQSYNGTAKWGDVMTDSGFVQRDTIVVRSKSDFQLYCDMADEPDKYGDAIFEWTALDEKIRAGPQRYLVEAYWSDREIREKAKRNRVALKEANEVLRWKKIFKSIAVETAVICYKNWCLKDIRAAVARIRKALGKQ
jgi:hypothetical protein